jgi:DNA-binding MarR family transcriptional regulator
MPNTLPLRLMELLFFAYRDFTGDPDARLQEIGLGRAHHRVLHFVLRRPGCSVAELLAILRITKQSLGRVLKTLVDKGLIDQTEGDKDKRQRLLYVTDSGKKLAYELIDLQTARIRHALTRLYKEDYGVIEQFLLAMTREQDKPMILSIISDPIQTPKQLRQNRRERPDNAG